MGVASMKQALGARITDDSHVSVIFGGGGGGPYLLMENVEVGRRASAQFPHRRHASESRRDRDPRFEHIAS